MGTLFTLIRLNLFKAKFLLTHSLLHSIKFLELILLSEAIITFFIADEVSLSVFLIEFEVNDGLEIIDLTLHTTKVVGFLFHRPLHCHKDFSFT